MEDWICYFTFWLVSLVAAVICAYNDSRNVSFPVFVFIMVTPFINTFYVAMYVLPEFIKFISTERK